jgi:uncharacterized protein involved in exopolysaccharide biosynthesis
LTKWELSARERLSAFGRPLINGAVSLMAKYAEILFRRRIRFVALLLIPVALGALIAFVLANQRAAATLSIADPSSFGASFTPVGWRANQTPAQNLTDSVSQVIGTPAFSRSLSNRLTSSGDVSNPGELQQVMSSIANKLKVSASGSHLMTVTYTCPRAALCLSVVTATMAILQEQLAKAQQDQAAASTDFWTSALKDARANLAAAQTALQKFAAANPGATIDASSSDPQVVQLVNDVQLWRAKAAEAQSSLSQAQYLGAASARFFQIGTTVVDAPHTTSSRLIGDGTSLLPGALVLLIGLAAVATYVFLLGWTDRTAGDPRALEGRLGIPVVATIPRLVGSGGA